MNYKGEGKGYSRNIRRAFYKILDFSFLMESDSKSLLDAFENSYGRFKKNDISGKFSTFGFFTVKAEENPYVIFKGKKYNLPPSENVHIYAVSFVMRNVIENIREYFLIHASAVERNGDAIVISGPPSHGKTSLALKLSEKGFNLLSDEYAPLCRKNGNLLPFLQAVGIEDEALELFWKGKYAEKDKRIRNDLRSKAKWVIDADSISHVKSDMKFGLKYFFLLKSSGTNEKEDVVEVAFLRNAETIKDKFCHIDEVTVISEGVVDGYASARFSVPKTRNVINAFDKVRHKEKEHIIYVEKIEEGNPDFSKKPSAREVSIQPLSIEIMKNMRNFTKGSELFEEFEGDYSRVIFEITALLRGVKCFTLKPGNLDDTADLLIDIIS